MRTRPHLAKPDGCHSNGLECEKNHKRSKLAFFKISYYFLFFNCEIYRELLTYDMYLRENLKSRPAFAAEITEEEKQDIRRFYQTEEQERHYLSAYDQYDWKQLSRMTHLEPFRYPEPHYVLFDYQERNPLNYEAKVQVIGYPIL